MEKKIYALTIVKNSAGALTVDTHFSTDAEKLRNQGQKVLDEFADENHIEKKEGMYDENGDFMDNHYEKVELGKTADSYDDDCYYEILIKLEEVTE